MSCGTGTGAGVKYALGPAAVTGTQLTTINAALNSQTNQWIVNFNLNGQGTKALAALTSRLFNNYYNSSTAAETSVLDQFAIVLDGKVVEAPQVTRLITGGSGQISGGSSNPVHPEPGHQPGQRAEVRRPAADVPRPERQRRSRPRLGSAQLSAGLIAAAIGLLLVVIYSFLYYRGLGHRVGVQPGHRGAAVLPVGRPAEQVRGLHPDAGRRRGPDRRHRHHGRLVRGLLRATARRGPGGPLAAGGGGARLDPRPADDPGLGHGLVPGRGAAVHLRHRRREGLRVHARPDHADRHRRGVPVHQADGDPAGPDQVLRPGPQAVRPGSAAARRARPVARVPRRPARPAAGGAASASAAKPRTSPKEA